MWTNCVEPRTIKIKTMVYKQRLTIKPKMAWISTQLKWSWIMAYEPLHCNNWPNCYYNHKKSN